MHLRRTVRARAALAIACSAIVAGCACNVDAGSLGDPGDGRGSERLAVEVSPTDGLAAGDLVTVRSDAFEASSIVGVAVCLQEADTDRRGVEACDEHSGYRYATGPDGRLAARHPVPRVITVGGEAFDCAERPGRCLLVAADADDYDRSGGQPLSFRSGLGTAQLAPVSRRAATDRLPAEAEPGGPFEATTTVTITVSGLQPDEPVLLARCTDRFESEGPVDHCEPLDLADAVGALAFRTLSTTAPRSTAEGTITVTIAATPWIVPYRADVGDLEDPGASAAERDGPPPEDAVDCTERAGRCSLVVAAAADTKRSAVVPYAIG